MVPQVIPIRRCRYCLVLVGDAEPPMGGARTKLRLPDLLLSQSPGPTLPPGRPPRFRL
jgi:hypothetical protein